MGLVEPEQSVSADRCSTLALLTQEGRRRGADQEQQPAEQHEARPVSAVEDADASHIGAVQARQSAFVDAPS